MRADFSSVKLNLASFKREEPKKNNLDWQTPEGIDVKSLYSKNAVSYTHLTLPPICSV